MISVNTHEAKTRLSELLAKVEKGKNRVQICRHGVPVAELVPIRAAVDPLQQHFELQKGAQILGDPLQPVSEENWPEEFR
ncbi:MAG TPA: type II toxin-antitoxin system prevent-host-death family antitoxin [Deltaproteobacteria bacterium]|nr:MAG: hypothetical protein A2048_10725 [Deltaproteobacteria bacterium GWA2_45_12]HBF11905.1 type II toxin-antitoxin system prevent-host-death family antitoxin [Deltaproteobacteria bacterium]